MNHSIITYSLWLGLMLILLLVLSSCEMDEREDADVVLQEGVASWYGPGFHGRRTSSGEVYDADDTTAAHRTLPFDTILRVVDTKTENYVYVRINDRGPYVGDRIIDLSRAAAEALDILESGTAHVRLELVEAGGPIPDDISQKRYTIQLGEYSGPFFAYRFAEQIAEDIGEVFTREVSEEFTGEVGEDFAGEIDEGIDGSIGGEAGGRSGGELDGIIGGNIRVDSVFLFQRSRFMVYYGHYDNIDSARADVRRLRELGHNGFVKQIN